MSSLQEILLKDFSELDNTLKKDDYINHNDDNLTKEINRLSELINEYTNFNFDSSDFIYSLFQDIINAVTLIDDKINEKYEQVKILYKEYFNELSSIIIDQLNYLEVVKRILMEENIRNVKLDDILPNSIIMTIIISSSTNRRNIPCKEDCEKIMDNINYTNNILSNKSYLLNFLQNTIEEITPNLSALLGSKITATLLCRSGGLKNLAEMPSQNIMVLGSNKNNKINASFATGPLRIELLQSIISQSDIVKKVPDIYKKKAIRLLSSKCSLCARIDLTSNSKNSIHGIKLREYILNMLEKIQEPPQKPLKKPLPIPKDFPKFKRGGRRIRKIKEKFKQTKHKKEMNRVKFGEEEEEHTVDGKTIGLGLLSRIDNNIRIKDVNIGNFNKKNINNNILSNSDSKNGNNSSISFTPYQGMIF